MATIPKSVAFYYKNLTGEHAKTILEMRNRILEVIPQATEKMKYAMPTFEVDGNDICGLMAHKKHIGYYPYSGSILDRFPEIQAKYSTTKGALHIPLDQPLPKSLVKRLIKARISDFPAVLREVSVAKDDGKMRVWQTLGLAKPAQRNLAEAGLTKLSDLARWSESDLKKLHGVGPAAIAILKKSMEDAALRFR